MANGQCLRRGSTAVTLGATPRSAEDPGLHGLRGFGPETAASWGQRGAELRTLRLREFWPDVRRGGMAEWSMAVVLKTTVGATLPGVRIPLPPPTPSGSIPET